MWVLKAVFVVETVLGRLAHPPSKDCEKECRRVPHWRMLDVTARN